MDNKNLLQVKSKIKNLTATLIRKPTFSLVLMLGSALIVGALLAYLLNKLDWQLVHQITPELLAEIFALTVLGTMLYILLVYLLIYGSGYRATLWQAYLALTASMSINYFAPVNVGFPIRVYLYHQLMAIPIATGTALVTVETLIGAFVSTALAIMGIILLFTQMDLIAPLAVIILLLVGLFGLMHIPLNRLTNYLTFLPFAGFIKRAINFGEQVQNGFRQLSLLAILGAISLNILMLLIQSWRLQLVLTLFGLHPPLMALLGVLTISIMAGNLSFMPMGLGARDISFTLLLGQLNVPPEAAISAAIIQRIFVPGWPFLLGLISINIMGLSGVEITKTADGK